MCGYLESMTANETSRERSVLYTIGMIQSAVFSSMYFLAPFYMISALVLLIKSPTSHAVWLFVSPIVLSILVKPMHLPWLVRRLSPLLTYFDYEEIHEAKPRNVTQ
ncbi:hypothetical protein MPSEU_000796100 [Mayamaea pseudoterrestris]|nr:hypothetical protein MPSEU_000796100 [Mayamaea pseudoterrestris]